MVLLTSCRCLGSVVFYQIDDASQTGWIGSTLHRLQARAPAEVRSECLSGIAAAALNIPSLAIDCHCIRSAAGWAETSLVYPYVVDEQVGEAG